MTMEQPAKRFQAKHADGREYSANTLKALLGGIACTWGVFAYEDDVDDALACHGVWLEIADDDTIIAEITDSTIDPAA